MLAIGAVSIASALVCFIVLLSLGLASPAAAGGGSGKPDIMIRCLCKNNDTARGRHMAIHPELKIVLTSPAKVPESPEAREEMAAAAVGGNSSDYTSTAKPIYATA
jgi:hypothetical protein